MTKGKRINQAEWAQEKTELLKIVVVKVNTSFHYRGQRASVLTPYQTFFLYYLF